MRKFIYILMLFFATAQTFCYGQYKPFLSYNGDTLSYLQENFVKNKIRYTGKSLNTLLNDLEFPIKSFIEISDDDENASQNLGLYLQFFGRGLSSHMDDSKTLRSYSLIVYWQIPASSDTIRKINEPYLDENWTTTSQSYFKFQVIKDIKLFYNNKCAFIGGRRMCEVCDIGSVNYNALDCALSYCNPESVNFDSVVCQRSICDPQSPLYDETQCIGSKCDPTSVNYDSVVSFRYRCDTTFLPDLFLLHYSNEYCEKCHCDPHSAGFDQEICSKLKSICDPTSPNYNATACAQSRCRPSSPNYNAVACEKSYCNASSPNYDAKVCEISRCNASSSNYDAIACEKSHCDVNSPNYDAKACEISRCDASSPNYDAVVCEKSRCNVSSPNYNFVICDQSICNTASPNYDAVGCEKSKCNVSSPNYDALACEKSHCDVNSPNFNVVACEQSRCRVNSPNYDPAQCDPATVDTFVAAYFTFSDLLGHSVNGNNLTLQEGATITDGKLVLTGGTPSNLTQPHASVANSPSLNPQTITVAVRIKPDDFVGCGNDAIVQKPFTSHTVPYYQYSLGIIGSYGYGSHDRTFGFSGSVNGQYDGLNSYPVNWTPGVWYTVVGVYDGANFKIYVNGTLAGTKAHAGTLDSFNTDVFIGKLGNSDYSIPATYEWVKIFNRALSDAEVSALGGK